MSERNFAENRLRICIVSFMFSPLVGGAEVQAEKLGHQLQAAGHSALILTFRHNRRWQRTENYDGLPIVRVGGLYRRNGWLRIGKYASLPLDLAMLLNLWRLRHQYDVVHLMQMSSMSALAALLCRFIGKPIVISIQSAGPDKHQRAQIEHRGAILMADTLKGRLDEKFLQIEAGDWIAGDLENLAQTALGGSLYLKSLKASQAYFQVLSNRCYTYLLSHGFRPEQVARIPNGVDAEQFRPKPAKATGQTILCVARLEYPKGVDVLLHAWGRMMQALTTSHLKPRLCIVGQGIFRPHLERIAMELGIEESVEFMGLRHDVVELLQQADGFVIPSRWEGMPNALLEAMACGLPCVATRVSGSEDLVQHEKNGLLVEPEQPEAMALALRRMLEDKTLARRMGRAARATILREYQLQTISERCLRLYAHIRSKSRQAKKYQLATYPSHRRPAKLL